MARIGEKISAYRALLGKSEGDSPRRPTDRWECNIKMDHRCNLKVVHGIRRVEDGNEWKLEVSATGRSLVQRSATDCDVSLCVI
jgi:hypothetical protein